MAAGDIAASRRISTTALVLLGIALAVALVVFVAPLASTAPDGLERVSADTGIDAGATEHHLADGPFAALPIGLAGIAGIAATFVVGSGGLWLVRRRRDRAGPFAA